MVEVELLFKAEGCVLISSWKTKISLLSFTVERKNKAVVLLTRSWKVLVLDYIAIGCLIRLSLKVEINIILGLFYDFSLAEIVSCEFYLPHLCNMVSALYITTCQEAICLIHLNIVLDCSGLTVRRAFFILFLLVFTGFNNDVFECLFVEVNIGQFTPLIQLYL